MNKFILLTALSSSILLASNTPVPNNGSDLKITIYNKNLAFVNDKRQLSINKGSQKLIYEGIPSKVITESVIPTFSGVNVNLFSQNYMYDLISQSSMIKNSINKEILYYNNHYLKDENPEILKGELLSSHPVMIKQSNGKISTLNSPNQIIFNSIPKNMITKPSLVWNIEAEKNGNLGIDLKYLTTGISWKSDYVLNLDKKSLDLNGWITINNNSGVSYNNAKITCLAGEVNRAPVPSPRRMMKGMVQSEAFDAFKEVKAESFSGYHIYKIPFKETINNKQKKQINFIDKKKVKYIQYGININQNFENYGKQNLVFKNILEFVNSKNNNNMGIPLPAGNIRMYKKDSKGETHFIGEDRINNIPNDETVKLRIGTMFDVVGDKTITKFKADRYLREVETTYEIRNRGEDPVVVKIEERIPTYGRKIFVNTSCTDNCSFEKKSAFYREFTIKLNKKETYSFTSDFEVNFH